MPWFKVDDGFYTSSKFLDIPREYQAEAAGLWMLAGVYSAHKMSDGFVSNGQLQLWEFDRESRNWLIAVGLWDEVDNGIQFHDWCDYQPTKESLQAKAVERSEKAKQNVAKRWDKNKSDTKVIPTAYETDTNGYSEPEPEPTTSNEVVSKARATRLPENFEVTEEMKDWAKEKHPTIDLETATANFRDYWTSKPTAATKLDWVATWRTWIRNTKPAPAGYRTTADLKLDRNRQARDNFLALAAQAEEQKQLTANPDWA
jgi:hypothetical protein